MLTAAIIEHHAITQLVLVLVLVLALVLVLVALALLVAADSASASGWALALAKPSNQWAATALQRRVGRGIFIGVG